MKVKIVKIIAFLFLSSSAFAYNQQEITQLIKNSNKSKKLHHPASIIQQTPLLNWEALQGPYLNGNSNIVVMKNNNTFMFSYQPYSSNKDIYKSTDGGQHWRAISVPTIYKLHHLISLDENRLLLAAGNQIYFSKDQGETWILSATIDESCDKLFSPAPNLVLLTTNFSYSMSGLYRSVDGGQTFKPARLGIKDGFPFFALGGRDNILLTSTDGIFISTNNGLLWRQPSVNWDNKLLWSTAVNHQHDIFLATSDGLYKTEVTGQLWEKLNDDIGSVEIIKMDGNDRLYAVGRKKEDSLYRSLDQGKNWELLHRFNHIIETNILDDGKILVNTNEGLMQSDISQFHYTKLGELPYSTSTSEHVIVLDKDHFFATALAYSGPLYASDNAGKTWGMIRNAAMSDVTAFNHQVVTLEYNTNGQQIMTSSNFGKTWQPIFQINKNHCFSFSSQHDSLIVHCEKESYFTQDLIHWGTFKIKIKNPTFNSYFSGKKIYITDGNSIQNSNDNGLTWTYLLDNLSQYRAYISGYNDEILIIAFVNAGIIKMTNDGKNWDVINDGLTNYRFTSLIVIDQNHYLISTDDGGIFYTQNGGKQWVAVNSGLNNLAVLGLSFNQPILLAGTDGSGVFKADLQIT